LERIIFSRYHTRIIFTAFSAKFENIGSLGLLISMMNIFQTLKAHAVGASLFSKIAVLKSIPWLINPDQFQIFSSWQPLLTISLSVL
jgi:hypothetical protein